MGADVTPKFGKATRGIALVLLFSIAMLGWLGCGVIVPIPDAEDSTADKGFLYCLWFFLGLTFGTDGVYLRFVHDNGSVTLVPVLGSSSNEHRLTKDAAGSQLSISPSGQSVGATFVAQDGTATRVVYAPDGFSNSIFVLNLPELTEMGSIAVQGTLGDVVLSPDQSTLYAAIAPATASGAGSIAVITTATNSIARTIQLPVGSYPQFEAVSPDGATLYVADNRDNYFSATTNYFFAIDTASGAIKANFTIPKTFASNLGRPVVSPDGLSIYVPDGLGFEVIDATTFQPDYSISTVMNERSHSVFTPDGRFLYAPAYQWISVIDAATSQIAARINLPKGALLADLAVAQDGSAVLAADLNGPSGQGALYQINPATSSIVATIAPPASAPLMSAAMQLLTLR